LQKGSLPFFADVNKDGLVDLVYNDIEKRLKVSYWNEDGLEFTPPQSFWDLIVTTSPCAQINH